MGRVGPILPTARRLWHLTVQVRSAGSRSDVRTALGSTIQAKNPLVSALVRAGPNGQSHVSVPHENALQ